ncbi:hypothetical protein [Mycobacterium paraseoulense]|uniref:Serine/threonine protein kinase n=1 Tax=Mycobacterium paraseoulense TaxID=590652 RepID=A0A1X0IA60_9MYCO|nr:hypothetical protein [Mycobacterium paraseoulense]MCV7395116.1 hypothetical protein [Mycobacterium paraseoulense]ORB40853.1 hypothetical protein BST39_13120 [Mycobacterium paraseoulense]
MSLTTHVGAAPAGAIPFNHEEQQIVDELPFGFAGNACKPSSDAPPGSVASLDCDQNAGLSAPMAGRFTRFADLDSMNSAFQNDLASRGSDYAPVPCPGVDGSPGRWHYTASPGETAGQIFCGTFKGAPDIEWTREGELLLLNVHGGQDLNSLFGWWDGYANARPAPYTR